MTYKRLLTFLILIASAYMAFAQTLFYVDGISKEDFAKALNSKFVWNICNALYEIALFDSKEDAIKAYEQSNFNQYNETGVIVEMILHE